VEREDDSLVVIVECGVEVLEEGLSQDDIFVRIVGNNANNAGFVKFVVLAFYQVIVGMDSEVLVPFESDIQRLEVVFVVFALSIEVAEL
jgi:hypothetical protein